MCSLFIYLDRKELVEKIWKSGRKEVGERTDEIVIYLSTENLTDALFGATWLQVCACCWRHNMAFPVGVTLPLTTDPPLPFNFAQNTDPLPYSRMKGGAGCFPLLILLMQLRFCKLYPIKARTSIAAHPSDTFPPVHTLHRHKHIL